MNTFGEKKKKKKSSSSENHLLWGMPVLITTFKKEFHTFNLINFRKALLPCLVLHCIMYSSEYTSIYNSGKKDRWSVIYTELHWAETEGKTFFPPPKFYPCIQNLSEKESFFALLSLHNSTTLYELIGEIHMYAPQGPQLREPNCKPRLSRPTEMYDCCNFQLCVVHIQWLIT